ncbi:MAG TPA: hypothetical protein VGS19_23805 [Streptosporangiaceae bacterium]|nr:hypothetical protein [Streptosporangiaceae bacterium]
MTEVGFELYREVRDDAPPDWTSGERLVAWVIADDAREKTRRSLIAMPELARRCGMTPEGVRKALQKLAERGFDFRVSHGRGKDGRDVYAANGHPAEYLVPDIFGILVERAGMAPRPVDKQT